MKMQVTVRKTNKQSYFGHVGEWNQDTQGELSYLGHLLGKFLVIMIYSFLFSKHNM